MTLLSRLGWTSTDDQFARLISLSSIFLDTLINISLFAAASEAENQSFGCAR